MIDQSAVVILIVDSQVVGLVKIPTEKSLRRSTIKTKTYNKNWVNR